jgi:hypothetical protein
VPFVGRGYGRISATRGGLCHASGPELGRAWNRAPECVTSASITVESRPCSGCGTDLSDPALATPTPSGESWWCEACIRRTLEAIRESPDCSEDAS